jgi:cytochrome bd ubiquinol oxidase subunit II
METLWFWLLAFMLSTYVVLDGFDFGAGVLHLFVAREPEERDEVLRSVAPVWDGNEVWLIAAGGILVMAFPALYATAFSGFYLPLMMVLWLLMGRALGIEIRHQMEEDRMWTAFWDVVFAVSSTLLAIFFGAAAGNLVRGVPLRADGTFFEPLWVDFRVGDETGILDWYTVLVAVTALAALTYHGGLWLSLRAHGAVRERSRRASLALVVPVMVLWAVTIAASLWVQPILRESLTGDLWRPLMPLVPFAAIILSSRFLRREQPGKAMIASGAALYLMCLGVAAALHPYVLPARNPEFALKAAQVASPEGSLAIALRWWIPGMLLVASYTYFVYARLLSRRDEVG